MDAERALVPNGVEGEAVVSSLWKCGYVPPKFTPLPWTAGIIRGENADVFSALEMYIKQMAERGVTYRFGLFGPPSVGKTMTSRLLAHALNRPFAARAAGNFKSMDDIVNVLRSACGAATDTDLTAWVGEVTTDGNDYVCISKPAVIFIDEAHALTKEVQNVLLSILEHPFTYQYMQGFLIDFRHVSFILATTDPSDLAKPLRTRLIESTFMPYSETTIAQIVASKYPSLRGTGAHLISKAAKAIPRRALQMGDVLQSSLRVKDDLFRCFGADEEGYDRTDSLIVSYLKSQTGSMAKLREAELVLAAHKAGGKVSTGRVLHSQALLETTTPYKPVGIQAIAHALGYTDAEDIFARIMWLETKGIVKRLPPRGVIYSGV